MNFIYNISIILKIVSKLQMLSFYGCNKWDGMVITGHRTSNSRMGWGGKGRDGFHRS